MFIAEHADRTTVDGQRWGVEPICAVLAEQGTPIAASTYYEHRTGSGVDSRAGVRSAIWRCVRRSSGCTGPTSASTGRATCLAATQPAGVRLACLADLGRGCQDRGAAGATARGRQSAPLGGLYGVARPQLRSSRAVGRDAEPTEEFDGSGASWKRVISCWISFAVRLRLSAAVRVCSAAMRASVAAPSTRWLLPAISAALQEPAVSLGRVHSRRVRRSRVGSSRTPRATARLGTSSSVRSRPRRGSPRAPSPAGRCRA